MLDQIIHYDQQLFLFLNNLGTEKWDGMWLYITNEKSWIPVYILILMICFHTLGWKKTLLMGVLLGGMIYCTDNLSMWTKETTMRLRPCKDKEIQGLFRYLLDGCGGTYCFFSAHAATNMALGIFLGNIFKKYYKYALVLGIFWGLMIGYSRIYVGAHFPLDVITGWLVGLIFGLAFYKIYHKLISRD